MKFKHPTLPEGFIFRPASLDDLEEITELLNRYWEPLIGTRAFTVDEMQIQLTNPGFDMSSSTRVILTTECALVGFISISDLDDPPVHPWVYGCVHQDFECQGLGTALMAWAQDRARQSLTRVPGDVRVSIYMETSESHVPSTHLFQNMGFVAIRYSQVMMIELDTKPSIPDWPDGIEIKTFRDRPRLEDVTLVVAEVFRDHWGYVEWSLAERTKSWRHWIENDPDFDPSLWYLAMDGEQIAGVALCSPKFGEDRSMGFVDTLAIRTAYRRKGLAFGLLHHVFNEFFMHGKLKVGLDVDADNLTGATRLYEKAGMKVVRQLTMYEKELRPGSEISKR